MNKNIFETIIAKYTKLQRPDRIYVIEIYIRKEDIRKKYCYYDGEDAYKSLQELYLQYSEYNVPIIGFQQLFWGHESKQLQNKFSKLCNEIKEARMRVFGTILGSLPDTIIIDIRRIKMQ